MNSDKLKISMVGYHNTLPLLFGLEQASSDYAVTLDIPSKCHQYFKDGEVDVALVPVGSIVGEEDLEIITDYCIGCDGEVETVCLYSHVEIRNVERIFLDSHSRTSQLLTKILAKKHWYLDAEFIEKDVTTVSPSSVKNYEAVLMIGDKAFGMEERYEYVYDLGAEWKKMTGLPFAFAVWISRPALSQETIQKLNVDLGKGVRNIDLVLDKHKDIDREVDLTTYYQKYIDFDFDDDKKKAVNLFLEYVME